MVNSSFYVLCRRNCSAKSLLLQQLHRARKEASELPYETSTPAEKLEEIKQDPESLEEIGSSEINQNPYSEVRQETSKVIPRMRLEPEKTNTPLSSHGGNGTDIEKETKMKAETVQNSEKAPEPPLTTPELPRYHIREVLSAVVYGLPNCLKLKNITYPVCKLEQKGIWFCYLERCPVLVAIT